MHPKVTRVFVLNTDQYVGRCTSIAVIQVDHKDVRFIRQAVGHCQRPKSLLSPTSRHRALQLLSQHSDVSAVSLGKVPCTQGRWRPGTQIQFFVLRK